VTVSGVSNSNVAQITAQNYQNRLQQVQSAFQQLGADLQAGSLTQAQQDFATLTQTISTPQQSGTNPEGQDLNTLGQALQAGNIADAQKAYSTLLQDLQSSKQTYRGHHHHHHHGGGAQQNNPITQAFGSLGSALQSGDLSGAQQAYSSIVQTLQQYGLNFASVSATNGAQTAGSSLNLTV
jgi:galactokinase